MPGISLRLHTAELRRPGQSNDDQASTCNITEVVQGAKNFFIAPLHRGTNGALYRLRTIRLYARTAQSVCRDYRSTGFLFLAHCRKMLFEALASLGLVFWLCCS